MPKPNKGEKKADYIDRCMGDKDMNDKYPNSKQRYVVCNALFKKGGDNKTNADEDDTWWINIASREDVSSKEGQEKYGNVKFADEKNKKYPIDTEEHIRAAWNYINKPKNAGKYSEDDVKSIKAKIIAAWKDKIDKDGPPSVAKNSEYVDTFVFNISGVKEGVLEGKKHIIAPVIFLTEGVHRGSGGAVYYPWEELSKTPAIWNGIPVPLFHPNDEDGKSISANSPEQIEKANIGRLWNVEVDTENHRLKGEIWFDVDKTRAIYPPLLSLLKGNAQIEVSTGLWFDSDGISGRWNNESYESTVRNYRPDHLAILLDEKGACSWDDGCGIRANMLGHTEVLNSLDDEVRKHNKSSDMPDGESIHCTLVEAYPDHFIFQAKKLDSRGNTKEVKLYKQNYLTDENDKVTTSGEPVEVKKDITYSEVKPVKEEVNVMREKEIIDALIKIPQMGLNEADTQYLQDLDEPNFAKLVAMGEKFKACKSCNTVVNKETDKKPITTEEYITNAPPEVKEVLESGIKMHKEYKSELIATITGNKKNKFSKEQLEAKAVGELEMLAELAEEVSVNYVGASGTINKEPKKNERNADGSGVPTPPVLNFERVNRNIRQKNVVGAK